MRITLKTIDLWNEDKVPQIASHAVSDQTYHRRIHVKSSLRPNSGKTFGSLDSCTIFWITNSRKAQRFKSFSSHYEIQCIYQNTFAAVLIDENLLCFESGMLLTKLLLRDLVLSWFFDEGRIGFANKFTIENTALILVPHKQTKTIRPSCERKNLTYWRQRRHTNPWRALNHYKILNHELRTVVRWTFSTHSQNNT